MGIYFKPLRRKIGVVTLFLTIVCIDGWLHSYLGLYEFSFLTRRDSKWQIVSMRGSIQIENSIRNGSYSTFRLNLPYATFTVPLLVATGFLLLPKARQRKSGPVIAEDPRL